MPSQETEDLKAREEQRKASKRATFELLSSKPRAEQEVTLLIPVAGGDGEPEEVTFLFQAIGAQAYDKLIDKHPPNTEQKAQGGVYDIHRFAPALLAQVCVDPELTYTEWKKIWDSPDWNRGETMQLFYAAVTLCNKGLDVPFTDSD